MKKRFAQLRCTPAMTIFLAAAILFLDYLTGPLIRFPITHVLPVGLAAWSGRRKLALLLAAVMPLARLWFWQLWSAGQWAVGAELVNTAIQWAMLGLLAFLISRVAAQQEALESEVLALEGMLPICSFCKSIRDESGHWHKIESYIASRSEVTFTHSYCPDCIRKHYPELGRKGAAVCAPADQGRAAPELTALH